jgi:hypothetical protein
VSTPPKDDDDDKKLRESRPSGKSFSTTNDDLTPLPPPDAGLPDPRRSEVVMAIRPSQRIDPKRRTQPSFSTTNEGDLTPIPGPHPEELTPDPKSMRPVPREDKTPPKAAKKVDRALTHPPAPDLGDRIGEWLVAHGALPAVLIMSLVVLAIHAHIFAGETAGDDLSFHFAESARLADCLRALDFDFWNPSANAGYASAYYYQVLPQLASALPTAIFGHHLFWFQLSVVLPHVLAPLAAYRGMRLLGATKWQSAAGALCVAFMNGESRWGSGNAGTFQVGLYTQTWALCAFPLALGHGARWLTQGTNLAAAVAWGAFVFLCHPFAGVTLGIAILVAWLSLPILWLFDQLFSAIASALKGRTGILGELGERWGNPPKRNMLPELWRGAILAVLLAITWLPVLLPLVIDREGFGGFPHRVSDEVGPGFKVLWKWYSEWKIFDFHPRDTGLRLPVLSIALPLTLLFARARYFRWLWAPAFVFALLLGLGPHMGKLGDDIFPPVRALGTLQTVAAMGIGAGAVILGTVLWNFVGKYSLAYWMRTCISAIAAALVVLLVVPGSRALGARIRVFSDVNSSRRAELLDISHELGTLPQGRKQPGPGAENHWWNLLPYVYDRVPTTLQMGGGGLQASPNYDFLWSQRDYVKTAWIFDAPYIVFMTSLGTKIPLGETLKKTQNYEVRKLPTPGLVSPVTVTGTLPAGYHHDEAGHKAAIAWIKGDQPMKDEVLAYVGSPPGNMDPPAGRMIRSWHQDSPGDDADIVAELEADKLTTFVVRESWHPRWHAYIDGEEVPIRRVTPDYPAVDVPAGKHVLTLRFERPWWMQASWLAWPLISIACWLLLRKRKPATVEV